MPRVAKPKVAKTKAAKKMEAQPPAEDLNLSSPAPVEAPPHEADERYERVSAQPRVTEPEPPPSAEAPRNGDSDTEMVLRPPTKPVETTETDTEHERRERRVTGAETAPSLKINIAELQ